jgi:hypothetical protein
MARNRFGKDYRLIETFDQKGRVRTTYEYIGDSYVFCSEAETVGRVKRHAPVRCLCGWLFWIAALSLPSGAGRKLYAVLPLAFSAAFRLPRHARSGRFGSLRVALPEAISHAARSFDWRNPSMN